MNKDFEINISSAGFQAGDYAKITLNGIKIYLQSNENSHYRGLHVVIINNTNGQIELAQVFDTYKNPVAFDKLTRRKIPKGYIVLAACKDDCVTNLSNMGKQWFINMGSNFI